MSVLHRNASRCEDPCSLNPVHRCGKKIPRCKSGDRPVAPYVSRLIFHLRHDNRRNWSARMASLAQSLSEIFLMYTYADIRDSDVAFSKRRSKVRAFTEHARSNSSGKTQHRFIQAHISSEMMVSATFKVRSDGFPLITASRSSCGIGGIW